MIDGHKTPVTPGEIILGYFFSSGFLFVRFGFCLHILFSFCPGGYNWLCNMDSILPKADFRFGLGMELLCVLWAEGLLLNSTWKPGGKFQLPSTDNLFVGKRPWQFWVYDFLDKHTFSLALQKYAWICKLGLLGANSKLLSGCYARFTQWLLNISTEG